MNGVIKHLTETDKQFIINYNPVYEVWTTKPKQTTTYGHAVNGMIFMLHNHFIQTRLFLKLLLIFYAKGSLC